MLNKQTPGRPRLLAVSWSDGFGDCISGPHSAACSGQDLVNDPTGNIGQTVFSSVVEERQGLVIQAQQMQDGGVDVVDMNAILYGPQSNGIRGAVSHASTHTSAGEPQCVAPRIVVAAGSLFAHRHPSKFTTPNDECVLEQAPLFQVAQQGGDGLVGSPTVTSVVLGYILVRIPATGISRIQLNKANTTLDHSAASRQRTANS